MPLYVSCMHFSISPPVMVCHTLVLSSLDMSEIERVKVKGGVARLYHPDSQSVDATNSLATLVASLHAFGILPTVNGQC